MIPKLEKTSLIVIDIVPASDELVDISIVPESVRVPPFGPSVVVDGIGILVAKAGDLKRSWFAIVLERLTMDTPEALTPAPKIWAMISFCIGSGCVFAEGSFFDPQLVAITMKQHKRMESVDFFIFIFFYYLVDCYSLFRT